MLKPHLSGAPIELQSNDTKPNGIVVILSVIYGKCHVRQVSCMPSVRYAKCQACQVSGHKLFILSVILLNVILIRVILLSVITLSVILLSVVAPGKDGK